MIVLTTMIVATAVGAGFIGEGMLFVNQAAASASLVVVLRKHGTGAERAVDAVVGGAVAFVVGVIVFPAAPMPRVLDAEREVLRSLADALEHVSGLLRSGARADAGWSMRVGNEIHDRLAHLATERSTALMIVRIAPRRWHQRTAVELEVERVAQLDLLANAVLSLVRSSAGALDDHEHLPSALCGAISALAPALAELADTQQPWPPDLVGNVNEVASRTMEHVAALSFARAPAIASLLRATGRDLIALTQAGGSTEE